MRQLLSFARAFLGDEGAASLVTFAIALPVLAVLGGSALQYGLLVQQKANLQQAADSAALGGAKNLQISNATPAATTSIAVAIANAALGPSQPGYTQQVAANVVDNNTGVQVAITRSLNSPFAAILGLAAFNVSAQAVAHEVGSTTPVCLVGLDPSAKGTISLDTSAVVQATGCAAYSNSRDPWSIESVNNAVLKTSLTCAVGGKQGNFPNFTPQPKSGCPAFADPLASRVAPSVGACDYTNLAITASNTLSPGVYCGGLTINGPYTVTLNPGVYVMKGGPLAVTNGGAISGQNVGVYLTGAGAILNFGANSTISLTAPKTGIMASLLFFEDRGNASGAKHQILSNHAETLLGTIYLSRGSFYVGSKAPVAASSAYTVIVADKVELSAGPTLVLNTNYGATDIPVPDGLGPRSGSLTLSQ